MIRLMDILRENDTRIVDWSTVAMIDVDLPDGRYTGKQTAYTVYVNEVPGSSFKVRDGLRGMDIPVDITITNKFAQVYTSDGTDDKFITPPDLKNKYE